ncbi:MAG: glycosyltransferase family 2 protein [Lentisphaeria bacterium]|nr:glycosyltransferase family 2 protein [Lentisphaeria bacterium]
MENQPKNDESYTGYRGFEMATHVLAPWQKRALVGVVCLLMCALIFFPFHTVLWINIAVTVMYLASTFYRVMLIDVSLRKSREIDISAEELATPPPGGWPYYIIQVPIYKEAAILPHLISSLSKMDYPEDRLEIRLLIEEDDNETMAAARALRPLPPFVIFPIPASEPRTKPKACNIGLANTGHAEFLVIYDAEDRPETDQLKKAALAFRQVPDDVACIQGKLNFYNSGQNFLTKCFSTEYATWFDLCLPGLDQLRAPIPLGGTSNHFRLKALRALKGWDEYNVTEDCDLGMRLFVNGWRTRILASTTWEQACPSVPFWIRQRSRWVKGYVQTYLVQTRHPLHLTKKLGFVNSLHFHLLVGASPLCQLVNPVYWILTLVWFFTRSSAFTAFFPPPVFVMAAACLFIGNFLFAYTCGIACVRRGFGHLAKYGLLMPVYWAMMSVAAWKGCLQLINKPHFWEKTRHFEVPEA